MKQTISITLSEEVCDFLQIFSKKFKTSKSFLIDKVFKKLRKYSIEKDFIADAAADENVDLDFVNLDFADFLRDFKK